MGKAPSDSLPVCRAEDPLPTLEEFNHTVHAVWETMRRERAERAERAQAERLFLEALDKNRAANVVTHARAEVGSTAWAFEVAKGPYGSDTEKCNLFVYDVLAASGLPVPLKEHYGWFNNTSLLPPLALGGPECRHPGLGGREESTARRRRRDDRGLLRRLRPRGDRGRPQRDRVHVIHRGRRSRERLGLSAGAEGTGGLQALRGSPEVIHQRGLLAPATRAVPRSCKPWQLPARSRARPTC
jgi:hypothetical protein